MMIRRVMATLWEFFDDKIQLWYNLCRGTLMNQKYLIKTFLKCT